MGTVGYKMGLYVQECGHYLKAIEDASPLWSELRGRCRSAGIEVMYTVIQSLTKDGRDRSHDYKRTGFHVPPGCWDAEVCNAVDSFLVLCWVYHIPAVLLRIHLAGSTA